MPSYRRPPAEGASSRRRRHAVAAGLIAGYLVAAVVVVAANQRVSMPQWLALHLLVLGAASNAVLVYSRHFAQALLHAKPGSEAGAHIRLCVFNAGAVSVLTGMSTGLPWLAVAGAVLVGLAVLAHTISLIVMARTAIMSGRLRVTAWYYVSGGIALVLGATLGGLLSDGTAYPVHWEQAMLLAHAHLNLLGWLGLIVVGTLFMLWPAVLRTRMTDNAPLVARRVLVIVVVSLVVAVTGQLLSGLYPAAYWVAAAGMLGYLAGVAYSLGPVVAEMRVKPPRTASPVALLAGICWLLVALGIDVVGLAMGGSTATHLLDRLLVPMLGIGVIGQIVTGAMGFLLPVTVGGGPVGNRRITEVLEYAWLPRALLANLGVLMLVLPTTGGPRVLAWTLVVAGLGSYPGFIAAALLAVRGATAQQGAAAAAAAARPGAGAAARPGAGVAARPAAGVAAQSGAGAVARSGAGAAAQSGVDAGARPGAEAAARSGAGDAAQSGAGAVARPGAGAAAQSGAEAVGPDAGAAARSGAGAAARPGAGAAARPGAGSPAQSGAGATARPGAGTPAARSGPQPGAGAPAAEAPRRSLGRTLLTVGSVIAVVALLALGTTGNWPGSETGSSDTAAATAKSGTPVAVTLDEFSVTPATITVAPGTDLTLTVRNAGSMNHDLKLDGRTGTKMLAPGERQTVDLGKITKDKQAWCTVPGHRAAGMFLDIRTTDSTAGHEATPKDSSMPGMDMPGMDMSSGMPHGTTSGDASPPPSWRPYDPALRPVPGGTEHKVTLRVKQITVEIAPGVKQRVWTYNGTMPGPVLHGKVGDIFTVRLVNSSDMPHSIDFHASQISMDKVMKDIPAGAELTYQFRADDAGAWLYHCATAPMIQHVAMGMYGAVVIDPPGLPDVAQSLVMVQSEFYRGEKGDVPTMAQLLSGNPDYVMFNGYANQYVHAPIHVPAGKRIRLWVVDAGPNEASAFHVVGAHFDTVFKEGDYQVKPGNAAHGAAQEIDLQPGEGGFVEFTLPEPGHYSFLTHRLADAQRGGTGMLVADK